MKILLREKGSYGYIIGIKETNNIKVVNFDGNDTQNQAQRYQADSLESRNLKF